MKLTLSLIAGIFCLQVFAQEQVILDREEVFASSDTAILVRTNQTPDKVTLKMSVPMNQNACVMYSERNLLVTSGSRCGYHYNDRVDVVRVCIARDSRGNCRRYETQRRVRTVSVPRTCYVVERYCADYGTITTRETDGVVIKFKNANALEADQTEEFIIRARQNSINSSNVVYDLDVMKALQTYQVENRGILGFDRIVIQGE
jgi:hypothetical protein